MTKNVRKNYKPGKFDKWHSEFFAMPSADKPATTKQASIRNLVSNVKGVAKDIEEFHSSRGRNTGRGRRKLMK